MPNESTGVTEQLKKRLAGLLPEGYDPELARIVVVAGKIQPITEMSDEDKLVVAAATEQGITAGGPDPITDGCPTIMRVVAWMCHAGVNGNGDGFVQEELPLAAAKVSIRNPLVMDWNHAAIVGGEGRIIGVWSKLDYAFDQKALGGAGAWGILAEGIMFAWAYPSIANDMLAEQQRHDHINFSMACIPSSVEFGELDGKRASILHNPVFFTLSALDVKPGDKDAVGVAVEGDNDYMAEVELRQQLTGASVAVAEDGVGTLTLSDGTKYKLPIAGILPWQQAPAVTTATLNRKAQMDVKLSFTVTKNAGGELEVVATASDADGKELAQVTQTVRAEGVVRAEELSTAAARISELEAAGSAAATRISELEAAIEAAKVANAASTSEFETLIEASKIAYAALEAVLATANAKSAELEATVAAKTAELEAANTRLAEIDTQKTEADRVALLHERIAELPEAYREAHTKREDVKRAELEKEWSVMVPDAWAAKLEDISLALPKGGTKTASYLERSRREAILPVVAAAAAGSVESISDRCQKFTRSSR